MSTLAEAIRLVPAGGRVIVRPGVYADGPVVVDKPVHISGEGAAILDGRHRDEILRIVADDVTIRGLTFRNVGISYVHDNAGVRVAQARNCVVEDNRFEHTFFAIYLARASGCRILRNEIIGSGVSEAGSGNGIHLWGARDVLIAGNRIRGHRDGIYLEFVERARVEGNLSERNLRYGLHFMFSDSCRYERNTFRFNSAGVAVMYSKHVAMTGNAFAENTGSAAYGLLLKDITDSEVRGNRFDGNTTALYAEGVNRVVIRDNRFERSGWAVRIMANSEDNVFAANTFRGNTFDVATNSRQSYSRFRGNYWDRYHGYDLDRDGRGDVPFRPVRLFSVFVEQSEPAMIIHRSLFVDMLDAAERVFPTLTPQALADSAPLMRPPR